MGVRSELGAGEAYTGNGFDRERKFVVEDYGRDFGGYDFVGAVYSDLEGTLRYSSPREDAEIAFAVDKATPDGDCRFRASTVGT